MQRFTVFKALALMLAFTATTVTYAVDSIDRDIANDRARIAADADRADSIYAADRAGAAAAVDRAAADTGLMTDRAGTTLADRARVDSALDRAVTETNYTTDRAAVAADSATRNIVPWIIGIALLVGLLYWATRRRTTYVPPVDRVDRSTTVPPVGTRDGTGTYNTL